MRQAARAPSTALGGWIGPHLGKPCEKRDYSYSTRTKDFLLPAMAFDHDPRVNHRRSVLIVPDKDADGLSGEPHCNFDQIELIHINLAAGTLLYQTLIHLGHGPALISVHLLTKGTSVHSDEERDRMMAVGAERIVVLDQGSRPGRALVSTGGTEKGDRTTLIIDHHMSDEASARAKRMFTDLSDSQFPEGSQVLTACHTPPIATAALLTYVLLRDLHPKVRSEEAWRALVGVIGGETIPKELKVDWMTDLGPAEAKWGSPPWPSELGAVMKR
jgi:hypothetical protein